MCPKLLDLAILLTVFGLSTDLAAQDARRALPYIPADANTVCVLDMSGIVTSPLGQSENWGVRFEQAYLDGAGTVPPWVRTLVRASHFVPRMNGESWCTAFALLPDGFELSTIADKEGTEIQELKGKSAVQSTRYGGYFVDFPNSLDGSHLLGLMFPASRQEVSSWISTAGRTPLLSSYLKSAASLQGPHFVLALDMDDMFDPAQIRYRLAGAASIKDDSRARVALTIDLQSLQGVLLAITVTDKIDASLTMDFKRDLGPEAEFLKPLFIEFLADAGADLPEFGDASVVRDAKSVTLKTELSQESFRKVLSLVTTPHPVSTDLSPEPPGETVVTRSPSPEGYTLEASQKYYRAVISNLRDLENAYRRKSPSYARSAVWHETFARRITHLSTDGVHPELVQFGDDMSRGLRALADLLRGLDVDIRKLDTQIVYRRELRYTPRTGVDWWWGPPVTTGGYVATPRNTTVEVHTNIDRIRKAQAQAADENASKRDDVWRAMANERSDVDQRMVETFGRPFLQE